MKELDVAPKSMLKFSGTPAEIGAQIWERMCNPAIRHASNNTSPQMLAQLYIGFLSAAMGSMAADFGHQNALEGAQTAIDSFAGMADELEGTQIQ
jgi:hypothetical protein